jgi:hypothetical protein
LQKELNYEKESAQREPDGVCRQRELEIKKELASVVAEEYDISISRACKLVNIHRSYFYYEEKMMTAR